MVLGRLHFYGEPEVSPDRSQASSLSAEELVVAYHERTKHHYHRFAASAGYMDWATQPDPFRRYEGASLVRLLFPEMGQALPYWQLYVADSMEPAPLSIDSVSLFFRYALSLTAWKRFHETTWSLRANPSSGNLHPTEAYALLPAIGAIHDRPGVYHYAPKEHGLERRADVDSSVWTALMAAFPEDSFLVGLSSIHWREAWKYGERAFRYCQHDVGHALATLRFAAAALGWKLFLLDRVDAMSQLLGLNRDADYAGAEREHPELLAVVVRGNWASDRGLCLSKEVASQGAASWSLYACSRSGEGRATPASDAARVPVAAPSVVPAWAPAVPAQRRGLPRSGCERLLRSGHRGRWGFQPRDDRRLHGQPGYLRRCVLSKSLLGGRSRRPGAVPRS